MSEPNVQARTRHQLVCPSGQPEMPGARLFAIATGNEAQPDVAYLERPIPMSPALLAKTEDVEPQRIFRIAVTCQESRCVHFNGTSCKLGQRIVSFLRPVTTSLPHCRIRGTCRWYTEQGRAACMRCPQLLTHTYKPTPAIVAAAIARPQDE